MVRTRWISLRVLGMGTSSCSVLPGKKGTWPRLRVLMKPSHHISSSLCCSGDCVRLMRTVNTVLSVEMKNWCVMKLFTWPAKSQTLKRSLPDSCIEVISIPNVCLSTSSSRVIWTSEPSSAWRYGLLNDSRIADLPARGWPQMQSLIRSRVVVSLLMFRIHVS